MAVVPTHDLTSREVPLKLGMDVCPGVVGEGDARATPLGLQGSDRPGDGRQSSVSRMPHQDSANLVVKVRKDVALDLASPPVVESRHQLRAGRVVLNPRTEDSKIGPVGSLARESVQDVSAAIDYKVTTLSPRTGGDHVESRQAQAGRSKRQEIEVGRSDRVSEAEGRARRHNVGRLRLAHAACPTAAAPVLGRHTASTPAQLQSLFRGRARVIQLASRIVKQFAERRGRVGRSRRVRAGSYRGSAALSARIRDDVRVMDEPVISETATGEASPQRDPPVHELDRLLHPCIAAITLAVVAVVGTLPSSIWSRVSSAHDFRERR